MYGSGARTVGGSGDSSSGMKKLIMMEGEDGSAAESKNDYQLASPMGALEPNPGGGGLGASKIPTW